MKIYCPLCHKKVEVSNPAIRDVQGSYGMRKVAEGICPKHKKPVSTYISSKMVDASNNPIPQKRTVKRKKRNTSPWPW